MLLIKNRFTNTKLVIWRNTDHCFSFIGAIERWMLLAHMWFRKRYRKDHRHDGLEKVWFFHDNVYMYQPCMYHDPEKRLQENTKTKGVEYFLTLVRVLRLLFSFSYTIDRLSFDMYLWPGHGERNLYKGTFHFHGIFLIRIFTSNSNESYSRANVHRGDLNPSSLWHTSWQWNFSY